MTRSWWTRWAFWIGVGGSILFTSLVIAVLAVWFADDGTAPDPTLYPSVVRLPDGRSVTCVVFDPPGVGGAIDCDWGTRP